MTRLTQKIQRINVGCGISPTIGWRNIDNSPSVFLSKNLFLSKLLYKISFLDNEQFEYIKFCSSYNIEWANVSKKIPAKAGSVDVIYSSHMLEHLDRNQAIKFLHEVKRVLKPGGTIRIVLPDLRKLIERYNINKDADDFILNSLLWIEQPKSFLQKLKFVLSGFRHHLWMYDDRSILKLLGNVGFTSARILKVGKTKISNPGKLSLNEREFDSLYVEAIKK
jgi:predicted SAM-dependent methyltransferase